MGTWLHDVRGFHRDESHASADAIATDGLRPEASVTLRGIVPLSTSGYGLAELKRRIKLPGSLLEAPAGVGINDMDSLKKTLRNVRCSMIVGTLWIWTNSPGCGLGQKRAEAVGNVGTWLHDVRGFDRDESHASADAIATDTIRYLQTASLPLSIST